jgi:hypothetical protein
MNKVTYNKKMDKSFSSIIQPHYLSTFFRTVHTFCCSQMPLATLCFTTKHSAPVTHFHAALDISEQSAHIFHTDVYKHTCVLLFYTINAFLLIEDIPPCFVNHKDSAVNANVYITKNNIFLCINSASFPPMGVIVRRKYIKGW